MMIMWPSPSFLKAVTFVLLGASFADGFSPVKSPRTSRLSLSSLSVLTERQMQFWEDVDTGLDDIEAFYAAKDLDIDRVRQFAKR